MVYNKHTNAASPVPILLICCLGQSFGTCSCCWKLPKHVPPDKKQQTKKVNDVENPEKQQVDL